MLLAFVFLGLVLFVGAFFILPDASEFKREQANRVMIALVAVAIGVSLIAFSVTRLSALDDTIRPMCRTGLERSRTAADTSTWLHYYSDCRDWYVNTKKLDAERSARLRAAQTTP